MALQILKLIYVILLSIILSACNPFNGLFTKTLGLTIYVDDPLRTKGGIVNILIKEMKTAEFKKKYASEFENSKASPGAPKSKLHWSVEVKDKVNFIYFEVPKGDYIYRFVSKQSDNTSVVLIKEKLLTVGGVEKSGSFEPRTDFGKWRFDKAHLIIGNKMNERHARGYVGKPDWTFGMNEAACKPDAGVVVCVPDATGMAKREAYIARADNREPSDPWQK